MRGSSLFAALLIISAVAIAYQIGLMRILSIAQWHHFAYMIISIAMLGFGASGVMLTVVQGRVRGCELSWLNTAAFLLPISLIGCYLLSQHVPFEVFRLVSEPRQFLYLLELYVLLAVPFFLASTCITLSFFIRPGQIGSLYCINMVGSGLGAVGAVGLLYWAHPRMLPSMLAVLAAAAHWMLVRRARYGFARGCGLFLLAGFVAYACPQPIRVSEYKALSYALRLPDAKILAERWSPLSVITAVKSDEIRETPGQIGDYPMSTFGPLPPQIGLYFDAGGASVVNDFAHHALAPFTYLDYVTSALAYRLVESGSVLIIGPGGGTDVLGALWHGAKHVTGVEVDPSVPAMMAREFESFSGGLFERPDVTIALAEGRGFMQSHEETFDVIQLPLFGSLTAVAAGVYALNESYLYTTEAFQLYLRRLSPQGVLAIQCWLKMPPCDAIKLFATAVEACEREGLGQPAQRLVFVRSWNNATILVSRSPLTERQISSVRSFCRERDFDLAYCPGLRADEANVFTVLEEDVYFSSAQAVLSEEREAFYRAYPFHVRPATDDAPYFFRFFKWRTLPELAKGMGLAWMPFVEWGYVTLVAALVQSIIVSVILIVVPLIALTRKALPPKGRGGVAAYFGALGIAYMFLEMAFIQKFMLFLAYPVYAVGGVLTAFLVFSGLGSYYAGQRARAAATHLPGVVIGIAVLAVSCLFLLPWLFPLGAAWSDGIKLAITVAVLAPLAFCMGIPFPTGLQLVSDRAAALVPWAWGINGCASVVGATLATFTAVHLGFQVVVLAALTCYAGAALVLARLRKRLRTRAA